MATDAEFDRAVTEASWVANESLKEALGPGVKFILIATRDRQTASTGTTDQATSRRVLVSTLILAGGVELVVESARAEAFH